MTGASVPRTNVASGFPALRSRRGRADGAPDGRSGAEALVMRLGETFGAVVEGWTATRRTSHSGVQLSVACRKKDKGRQSGRPGQ
jgi:hypothetical protein